MLYSRFSRLLAKVAPTHLALKKLGIICDDNWLTIGWHGFVSTFGPLVLNCPYHLPPFPSSCGCPGNGSGKHVAKEVAASEITEMTHSDWRVDTAGYQSPWLGRRYARISIYEMIWNLWHPPTDNHKYVSCNMLQHTVACSKQHQTLFVTRTGLLHQRRLGPPPMLLAQPKCDKASRWKCGYDDMVWWRPIAKKAWPLVAQILKEAPDVSRPPKWS
jgi:hypothetical protein